MSSSTSRLDDRFYSLFNPPTPPATPQPKSLFPVRTTTPSSGNQNNAGHAPLVSLASPDQEFGAFVSVPASQDPLWQEVPPTPTVERPQRSESKAECDSSVATSSSLLDAGWLEGDFGLAGINSSSSQQQRIQVDSHQPPSRAPPGKSVDLGKAAAFLAQESTSTAFDDFGPLMSGVVRAAPQSSKREQKLAHSSGLSSGNVHEMDWDENEFGPYGFMSPLEDRGEAVPSPPPSTKRRSPRSYSTLGSLSSKLISSFITNAKSGNLPSNSPPTQNTTPNSLASVFTPIPGDTTSGVPAHPSANVSSSPSLSNSVSSLPTQVISHGSPFAPHMFVPPSGAPGFTGDLHLSWDKGYSNGFEPMLIQEEVKLVGRREMTLGILDISIADQIRKHLPALSRLVRSWTLLYSLDQHGISLNTLYSRCEAAPKRPGGAPHGMLVVVRDEQDAIFGAFIGEGVKVSKSYYGSGESFLWKANEEGLDVFKWTGKNDYVALCDSDFMSFGGGDGAYGLYLDEELAEGTTAPCPTFGNSPLCASGRKRGASVVFECVGLEVWSIGG